jgi:hypothetical protein
MRGNAFTYSHGAKQLHMNDTNTDTHNPIFDLIIKHIPLNNKPLINSSFSTTVLKGKKKKTIPLLPPPPYYCITLLTLPNDNFSVFPTTQSDTTPVH